MENNADNLTRTQQIPLQYVEAGAAPEVYEKFPHLRGFAAFKLLPESLEHVAGALRGQVIVTARSTDGAWVDATGLQLPGVLDDLYTYHGELGVVIRDGIPTLRLWAPTAQSVTIHLFADAITPDAQPLSMQFDADNGVWSAIGTPDWIGKFYKYEVVVFAPKTGKIERNLVTDPYSVSLTMNSSRSQVVDLVDPALMPSDWQTLHKPNLAAPEDIVLYELHVRDFSIHDQTVTPQHRGKFGAFSEYESNGMKHLRGLAQAGLTHIHLLPVFDIATVNEDPAARKEPDATKLASFRPDSDQQQAAVMAVRDQDGFNWGYDPFHYTVPEGSYATDPDGASRILEFRQMVQALSNAGLRVIMDVVYNHTHSGGQDEKSVLDRIVPGYYHRLNDMGVIENSTCCSNTATEHTMMEKLMLDSLRTWATAYKVDGFRFDLMGHHMLSNMLKVRAMLQSLTLENDGVDGAKTYVYGEGWDFGEVANNWRGRNATQRNMSGTGIGTFSDRMRDAARGGSAFSGVQDQGFITGLFTAPNATWQGHHDQQRGKLLGYTDQIRIGLAGTLRDFEIDTHYGVRLRGQDVHYNGQPTGYAIEPREVINYIEAHDNETLWDAIQLKAANYTSLDQRVRMQMLGNSLVCLAQGIPFFHAGQELLRSKSLDRNSYNSGDWFNKLDWTYETNNWGVGLPPGENHHHWPLMGPLLANASIKPGKAEISRSLAHFKEMLQIRKSSKLFRLRTVEDIRDKLRFWNSGQSQIPGLIVLHLADVGPRQLDDTYAQIVVLFNALPTDESIHAPVFAGTQLRLHPVQAAGSYADKSSFNPDTSVFHVPAYTAAVFVEPKAHVSIIEAQ